MGLEAECGGAPRGRAVVLLTLAINSSWHNATLVTSVTLTWTPITLKAASTTGFIFEADVSRAVRANRRKRENVATETPIVLADQLGLGVVPTVDRFYSCQLFPLQVANGPL